MARSRFYQLEYSDHTPAYLEDLGEILKLSGMLLTGQGASCLLLLPTAPHIDAAMTIASPTLEEWCGIIAQADQPEVFIQDESGTVKAIHRKVKYAISGAVQQQIWVRDQFLCMFCGGEMGKVQLTVDHFVPLELGGENVDSNLISACRRCNKQKGKLHPEVYCKKNSLDYEGLQLYLLGKCSLQFIAHLA